MKEHSPEWTKKEIIEDAFKSQEFNVNNTYPKVTNMFDTLDFIEPCNEKFLEADKAVLMSEIPKYISEHSLTLRVFTESEIKNYLNEEIEYLENHVKNANKGIDINVERIESWIFEAKKIRRDLLKLKGE